MATHVKSYPTFLFPITCFSDWGRERLFICHVLCDRYCAVPSTSKKVAAMEDWMVYSSLTCHLFNIRKFKEVPLLEHALEYQQLHICPTILDGSLANAM